jgi:hypothetical protein
MVRARRGTHFDPVVADAVVPGTAALFDSIDNRAAAAMYAMHRGLAGTLH